MQALHDCVSRRFLSVGAPNFPEYCFLDFERVPDIRAILVSIRDSLVVFGHKDLCQSIQRFRGSRIQQIENFSRLPIGSVSSLALSQDSRYSVPLRSTILQGGPFLIRNF